MYARPGSDMLKCKVTLKRLMFGCMLGQALKCLTARWTPKAVYFRNAMRVKPSPRTKHIALAGDLSVPQADAAQYAYKTHTFRTV